MMKGPIPENYESMPLRDPHVATIDRRGEDQATGTEVNKPLLPWNASMVILVRFCDLLQKDKDPPPPP